MLDKPEENFATSIPSVYGENLNWRETTQRQYDGAVAHFFAAKDFVGEYFYAVVLEYTGQCVASGWLGWRDSRKVQAFFIFDPEFVLRAFGENHDFKKEEDYIGKAKIFDGWLVLILLCLAIGFFLTACLALAVAGIEGWAAYAVAAIVAAAVSGFIGLEARKETVAIKKSLIGRLSADILMRGVCAEALRRYSEKHFVRDRRGHYICEKDRNVWWPCWLPAFAAAVMYPDDENYQAYNYGSRGELADWDEGSGGEEDALGDVEPYAQRGSCLLGGDDDDCDRDVDDFAGFFGNGLGNGGGGDDDHDDGVDDNS